MRVNVTKAASTDGTLQRSWTLVAAAALLQFGVAGRAGAAPLPGTFTGGASTLGVTAAADAVDLQVHNGAHEGCPCRGTHGNTRTKTVSNVMLGGTVVATTAQASASGTRSASAAAALQTAQVEGLNLFDGLITAKLLEAAASVTATPDTLQTSEDGTQILDLVIAGQAIDPNVPDNTAVPLPGVGTVTVRATKGHDGKKKADFSIDMLAIDVTTANSLGLPVGAKLVVGRASAGYDRTEPAALLSGAAIGTRLKAGAGTVLQEAAGVGAGVGLPGCSGTNDGKVRTKSVAKVDVPGIVSVGLETDTATGGPAGSADVATTTSTLANVSLLAGLVTVKGLDAVAQASRTGDTTTTSTTGSGIDGLAVAGIPITLTTSANTTVPVPGVGYLVANEQVAHKTSVSVNALHLHVNTVNLLGLPVGAEIILGHASAGAAKS